MLDLYRAVTLQTDWHLQVESIEFHRDVIAIWKRNMTRLREAVARNEAEGVWPVPGPMAKGARYAGFFDRKCPEMISCT